MMAGRRAMTWSRVRRSGQVLAAHASLLCFTFLLVYKLTRSNFFSWWWIFLPLWAFHGIIARGRFSLPAPSPPHDRHWAPCHTIVATPLLVAFELLLCIYLECHDVVGRSVISLRIVFLPLLVFELIILVDNVIMCKALMPGDEDIMTDEAIWETLPHFWVAVSMVFFIAATLFTLLKVNGDVRALGWWDLFINFGIAECFTFLVCTKWSNPSIHRQTSTTSDSTTPLRRNSIDSASTSAVDTEEDEHSFCGLEDIGGHLMKIPVLVFQVLLCMKLEGTPSHAKNLSMGLIFLPLFILHGFAIVFSFLRLVEKFILLLQSSDNSTSGELFPHFSEAYDVFGFLRHGSKLLGWWSIDEGSQEEHANLWHDGLSGYSTFRNLSPQIVKKMPRNALTEEVWRLQAAFGEQTERSKYLQEEYDRIQNEKVLCRVCFERDISIVLLPCKHRILCSICSAKCKCCPICRKSITQRMTIYDV